MYDWLRQLLIKWVPPQRLMALEPTLRWWLWQGYRGKRCYCPLCDTKLGLFMPRPGGERQCPRCGSLGHHRRVWILLEADLEALSAVDLLHLQPGRALQRRLQAWEGLQQQPHMGNTLPEAGRYDRIIAPPDLDPYRSSPEIASHLYGLLKPGGKLYVPEPNRSGSDPVNERLIEALEAAGFHVRILAFDQQDREQTRRRGLSPTERVWIAEKR